MSEWTDDEGRSLGTWIEVDGNEWAAIVIDEGGLENLVVAATCTDPDGAYGSPRIYTAWARPNEDVPLVDTCSTEFEPPPYQHIPKKTTFRKFKRNERLVTLPQLAKEAGLEYRTAYTWMQQGVLIASIQESDTIGHANYFSNEDVDRARRLVKLRNAGLSFEGVRMLLKSPVPLMQAVEAWKRKGRMK